MTTNLLFPIILLLTILTLTQATPAFPLQPTLTLRNVDNVGPALSNATQEAITRGKAILAKYTDIVNIVAIPTGVAVAFFGYFLLAPVLFLASFISGGGACFVAVNELLGSTTPAAAWISIAAMLLGGALLGFFALRALNLGMFLVGAALGVVLASALKTTLIAQIYPQDPRLAFIVAAVTFGLIFGLLALFLQKQMLIFSTAYAGACACVFGIGHFAGHFPTTDDLTEIETGKFTPWILMYIGLAALIGTVGMFFQFWLARGKDMPEHAPHDRRRQRRRSRPVDYGGWTDDDWTDDAYVERFPLPSSKREPVRASSHSSIERPRYLKEPVQAVEYAPVQHSWSSVRNADDAFDAASSSTHRSTPAVQASSAHHEEKGDVSETNTREVTVHIDVAASSIDQSGSNVVKSGSADGEIKQLGAASVDADGEPLEHVSLESEAETRGEAQV